MQVCRGGVSGTSGVLLGDSQSEQEGCFDQCVLGGLLGCTLDASWEHRGWFVGDLGCSALEAPPSFSSCMLLKINLLKLSSLDLSWRSPGTVLKAFDASFG